MQNRLFREKEEAYPKGIFKKMAKQLRNSYNYLQSKASLPPILYTIRTIFIFYEFALPCYYPLDRNLWTEGRVTSIIMKFLALFSYFGAAAEDSTSLLVSFLILIIAIAASFIVNETATLFYRVKGRMPKGLMLVVLFFNDFLIPIFSSYIFAQIGLLLGKIFFDSFEISHLVGVIILTVLVILRLYLYNSFYYPAVVYSPGNTLFWISPDYTFVFIGAGLFNLIGRMVEFSTDMAETILRVIFLICEIVFILYMTLMRPFIKQQSNSILIGVLFGGLLVSLFQAIDKLDQDVIFLFSIIFFFLTFVLSNLATLRIDQRILNKLDLLYENPEDTPIIIKNKIQMTLYIRIAIHYGHPYLLTLAPFREAIQRYPKSLTLWEHYIRFIAIYPEENIALMTAIEEVKTRFPSSKIMKTIRLLSTTLLQSRNKHMSSSLKRKLKQFDESNRQIKSIMISFWTAISENGSIAAYDIAKQVIQQRDELKSQYLHQLSLFPNNWILCLHYSKCLYALDYNQTESEYWATRAQMMRKSDQIYDRCHQLGLITFPNLPNEIHDMDENNAARRYSHGSIASRSSVSSRSQTSQDSMGSTEFQLLEEKKTLAENIRLMGLKVPVPFITHLIMFVLIIFIIFGVIFPFIPGIPFIMSISSFTQYFKIINDATSLPYDASRNHYLLSYTIGKMVNPYLFLNYSTEMDSLQISPSTMHNISVLPALASRFSQNIDSLIKDIGDYYDMIKSVSDKYFKTNVNIRFPGTTMSSTVVISDALNYASAQLFGFNNNSTHNYQNESWFIFTIDNIMNITGFFFEFCDELYANALTDVDDSLTITIIVTVVVDIILVLLTIVYAVLLYKMRSKWNDIISIFSKIPKSSIHQTLAFFSTANSNLKVSDEERLYVSEFTTMVTSRDSHGGIPIPYMAFLYFVLILLIIVSTILIFITSSPVTKRLKNIPKRYIILRQTETTLFYILSLFNIYIGSMRGTPIINMSETENKQLWINIKLNEEHLISMMDELVIGDEDGSNYGLMSTTDSGVVDAVFKFDTLLRENGELPLHDFMFALPDLMLITSAQQLLGECFVNVEKNKYLDVIFLYFLNHLMEHHWAYDLDDKYAPMYKAVMDKDIPNALGQIFGLPIIFIVAELVIVVILINLFQKTRKTIRFCLSSLSFIDSSVVTQSQELSNLLSGQYVMDKNSSSTLRLTIEAVPQFSPEVIVLIGKDKRILYINSKAETKWNLKDEDCNDVDLDLVLRFDGDSTQDRLNDVLDGSLPKMDPVITSVVIVSSEKVVPAKVSFYPVKEGKNVKQLAIMISDTSKQREMQEKLVKEQEATRQLQLGLYPKEIRKMIDVDNNSLIFVSKRIVVITIQVAHIDDLLKSEDPTARLAQFKKTVFETINNDPTAAHGKTLGSFEFVLFNILGEEEASTTDKNAIQFCQNLSNNLKEHEIQAQFGFASDTKCPIGMMDRKHMSFDIFGRCMHNGMRLAANADPNTLDVGVIDVNSVSSVVKTELTQKQISAAGTPIQAFEYKLK